MHAKHTVNLHGVISSTREIGKQILISFISQGSHDFANFAKTFCQELLFLNNKKILFDAAGQEDDGPGG
jgi:hypothetical protein